MLPQVACQLSAGVFVRAQPEPSRPSVWLHIEYAFYVALNALLDTIIAGARRTMRRFSSEAITEFILSHPFFAPPTDCDEYARIRKPLWALFVVAVAALVLGSLYTASNGDWFLFVDYVLVCCVVAAGVAAVFVLAIISTVWWVLLQ